MTQKDDDAPVLIYVDVGEGEDEIREDNVLRQPKRRDRRRRVFPRWP
jgi:hypothetical protein